MNQEELLVKATLDKDLTKKFLRIKQATSLKTKAEVLRLCIAREYEKLMSGKQTPKSP